MEAGTFTIERALRTLGDPRGNHRDAFDVLSRDASVRLRRYLHRRQVLADDAEDILQHIIAGLWDKREQLTFPDAQHWYAYLYSAARSGLADLYRRRKHDSTDDLGDLIDPQELVEFVELALDSERLHELADEVWLGQRPRHHALRLLLAKMIYGEGMPLPQALLFLRCRALPAVPESETELAGWLSEPWVLRSLAFTHLYRTNDELAALILGLPYADSALLDALSRQAATAPPQEEACGGWTWAEVEAILWRIRSGCTHAQVVRRLDGRMNEDEIHDTYAKCRGRFPFEEIMLLLWNRLEGHELRQKALSESGLWKRLVFHYHCRNFLTQEDILDRTRPAAHQAGYALNDISMWISAYRLRGELINRLHKTWGTA